MRIAPLALFPAFAGSLVFSGCVVGPDYQKPATPAPAAFVETGPWKTAAPRDHLPKGTWWTIYHDSTLDRLATQATAASPTLAAALARRDQARAVARLGRADQLPRLDVNASAERGRSASTGTTSNTFSLPLDLRWELDLWGRVRRSVESARAAAAASEADYQQVLLSVQADVARAYFSLRALDVERALIARTLDSRRRSLEIVQRRFKLGASGELDVSLAATELATAESDLLGIQQDRTALHYALAVLCGQLPESFTLAADAAPLTPAPAIPTGLPSDLLERRPDVAAAERTLAATHARIGVAQAAFFPSISLTGSAGYRSDELGSLLEWSNRQWSLGPSVSLPIFNAGANRANRERAEAVYAEAIADYRRQVLVAFSEVETTLSDLRLLAERAAVLERAVASSRRAADLVVIRYRAGQINYLDVTAAERTAIANERLAAQIRGQHLIASVLLIKALGGGW